MEQSDNESEPKSFFQRSVKDEEMKDESLNLNIKESSLAAGALESKSSLQELDGSPEPKKLTRKKTKQRRQETSEIKKEAAK